MIRPFDRTGTYRTYSMADGLAGVRIEHIAEDSEGYLWFATWGNGVSRFDGDEFQNFTERDGLCSDQTFFVQKDRQNRLWFGTANGVCWYDGADFHHLQDDAITGRTVQSLYEDREGRIWFGGGRTLGVLRWHCFSRHDPRSTFSTTSRQILPTGVGVGVLPRIRKDTSGLALKTLCASMAHPSTAIIKKRVSLKMGLPMSWTRTIPARCGLVGSKIETHSGAMPMATSNLFRSI